MRWVATATCPSFFGKVHATRKTPHGAIAGSAVLIAFMAVALPIEAVASAANIMFLLLFIQVQVVLIALRRKMPEMPRGFRVPLVPYVPAVGIVLQLLLAAYLFVYSPLAWLSAAAWIAIGFVVYFTYARKRDQAYEQVVVMREAARRKDYRILACLKNDAQAEAILGTAAWLAHGRDAELIGLTVIEVPERVLLAHGLDRLDAARRGLDRAMSAGPAAGRRDQVTGQGFAPALLRHRRDGARRAMQRHRHRANSPCGHDPETGGDGRCTGNPGSARAHAVRERRPMAVAGTADSFRLRRWAAHAVCSERLGSRLRTPRAPPCSRFTYSGPKFAADERNRAAAGMRKLLDELCSGAESRVVIAGDTATALLREARGSDVIVAGGTEAGMLEELLSYTVPLELGERASVPVITACEIPADPKRWMN